MIVNLTPHPLSVYPNDCPDQIEPGEVEPLYTVPPSGQVARLAEDTLGTWFTGDFGDHGELTIAVEGVDYGSVYGLPPLDTEATDINERPRTYYVVPLVVALAARGRPDLLVVYRDVRSKTGTVLGCRQLAQPC